MIRIVFVSAMSGFRAACIATDVQAVSVVEAFELADKHYRSHFSEEYRIAEWERISFEAGNQWELMFAHRLPKEADSGLPRFGRVYWIDKNSGAILKTFLVQ